MQNIKKYFMTLALLLTAVGGAWAADAYEEFTTADEEMTQLEFTGEHIKITGTLIDNDGLMIVSNYPVTISALNGKVITKVELTVSLLDLWNSTYAITSTPNATIEGTYAVGQKLTITPTGANPSEITLSANVDGQTASIQVKNWKVYYADATEWELKPDETGKNWILAKMPANDVELQVEYFAESNLFLSKDALADKANIAVTAGETAVTFDDDGKSTNTVTEGTPMTVKFNGTKKVLGMKVAKKAATPSLNITSPEVGQVIGSDGKNYAAANVPSGVDKVAMIAYVSGSNGLAIALADESSLNWTTAKSTCEAKTPAFTGGTWKLPTQDEWKNMFKAFGGNNAKYTGLNNALAAAGGNGSELQTGDSYWSSSEIDENKAYLLYLLSSDGDTDWYDDSDKNIPYRVRACLAF